MFLSIEKSGMKKKIIDILKEIRPEFDFSDDVNFVEQGMLDSFDIVSLVVALDNEFRISIDGMDIMPENFSSVDRIAGLLIKKGVKE
jgi:acyl carrier protein